MLKIHYTVSSSYNQQSSGQVEECIKFIKLTLKTCFHTNWDVKLALLQIRSMLIRPGLPNPAKILFSRLIRGLMSKINRKPILYNCDDYHNASLKHCQHHANKAKDTWQDFTIIPKQSTVVAQREDGGPWSSGAWQQRLQEQIIQNVYEKDQMNHN